MKTKLILVMMLINYNICKNIRWSLDNQNASKHYIKECYEQNKNRNSNNQRNQKYIERIIIKKINGFIF